MIICSLSLNLRKVNSVQSPDSCENNVGSLDKTTLSSDTYHTAASGCSTLLNLNGTEPLMSDSGVELRPSSRPHDDSDLSSTEDFKVKIYNCLGMIVVIIFHL